MAPCRRCAGGDSRHPHLPEPYLAERDHMGRDIQASKISGEDRRNYREKLRRSLDVFDRMLRERSFDTSLSLVGQEIELNLLDEPGEPSLRTAAVLDPIANPACATELGQSTLAS